MCERQVYVDIGLIFFFYVVVYILQEIEKMDQTLSVAESSLKRVDSGLGVDRRAI